MLGRISWWIVENVFWRAGLFSPPPPPEPVVEPTGARRRTEFILAWKRCSLCGAVLVPTPANLEFLTANQKLHSESYLATCAERHPFYVTVFPQGTDQMDMLAQDEVWKFLPKSCGRRTVDYRQVEMTLPERWASELRIEGGCGLKDHDHSVYLRWYEKPGWSIRTAKFGVRS